jgi:hypothetical protein
MFGRRNIIGTIVLGGASIFVMAASATLSQAADKELKIGFVGVTSGPARGVGRLERALNANPRRLDQRKRRQDRRRHL